MDEVVWGIIGCGDVTERKSGPAFADLPGSRLAAVMRRDAALAADYARRHGVPRWYDDVDALLADDEVNAIYVATPPSSHRQLTERALASGRPVLVEKPIALDGAEADAMLAAARAHGQPLFVAYYRRCLERFERLRALVQEGALGPIRCIQVRHVRPEANRPRQAWKVQPAVNGGGLFVDVQVHVLDWLDHCFGPPTVAQGLVRRLGADAAEDLVAYQLGWPEGPVASGLYCFGVSPEEEHVTIGGRDGTARMPFLADGPLEVWWNDGRHERIVAPDPEQTHGPMIARVVEHLQGGRPAPVLGEACARTTYLVDQLYADYRRA